MKGMVFNLLENFIIDSFGGDIFHEILDKSNLICKNLNLI